MAQYKKLSEYEVNAAPNDEDLIPLIVSNGDGTYENVLMEYGVVKGTPGSNGSNGVGVPTGGSSGQILKKNSSTDYDTSWGALDKTAVGLGNVDNTSDANKPVSTAVTAAIAAAIAQAKQDQYPVGSIYFNATNSANPSTLLGFGTWVAWGAGRVPVGFDSTQTEFDAAEETGGAKTHTLSVNEMPSHTHSPYGTSSTSNGDWLGLAGGGQGGWGLAGGSNNNIYRLNLTNTGGGAAHNNLQPYITVYMWKRTA